MSLSFLKALDITQEHEAASNVFAATHFETCILELLEAMPAFTEPLIEIHCFLI